jgi:hypothetical protein
MAGPQAAAGARQWDILILADPGRLDKRIAAHARGEE